MATLKPVLWGGNCKYCKVEFKKGEMALFEPGEGCMDMFHVKCPEKPVEPLLKDGGKNGGKP